MDQAEQRALLEGGEQLAAAIEPQRAIVVLRTTDVQTALGIATPHGIDKHILHHSTSNIVFEESRYRVVAPRPRQLELLEAVLGGYREQAALDHTAGVDHPGGASAGLPALGRHP